MLLTADPPVLGSPAHLRLVARYQALVDAEFGEGLTDEEVEELATLSDALDAIENRGR